MSTVVHTESRSDIVLVTILAKHIMQEEAIRELESVFGSIFAERHCKTILMDISQVEIMNARALGTFIGFSTHAKKQGYRFVVCGMQQKMRDLMMMLKCVVSWEMYEDCHQARLILGFD